MKLRPGPGQNIQPHLTGYFNKTFSESDIARPQIVKKRLMRFLTFQSYFRL
jgi:hypothetical protein